MSEGAALTSSKKRPLPWCRPGAAPEFSTVCKVSRVSRITRVTRVSSLEGLVELVG
jgi:hypothetical protein